jgi:hypothetical protein
MVVVIHNYAAVPQETLIAATDVVSHVCRLLRVDIEWNPASPPDDSGPIPRLELGILPRTDTDDALASVTGVDAPSTIDGSVRIAHVLYQRVDDHATSAHALALVMAHLIAGTLQSTHGPPRATIVRANRDNARRLMRGAPMFTDEAMEVIRVAAAALARQR